MTDSDMDALIQQVRTKLGMSAAPKTRRYAPADSSAANLARLIDHTILKADATASQVTTLCDEARRLGFASVCINPTHVALAARLLANTPVRVCTVAGFPWELRCRQ